MLDIYINVLAFVFGVGCGLYITCSLIRLIKYLYEDKEYRGVIVLIIIVLFFILIPIILGVIDATMRLL